MREEPDKLLTGGRVIDATDRREAIRVPHCAPFALRPSTGGAGGGRGAGGTDLVIVVLQDLSATGMGILHSDPMRIGDRYDVPLERQAEGAAAQSLVCTVVRCDRLDDGLYSIGFVFNSSAATIEAGSRQLAGIRPPR